MSELSDIEIIDQSCGSDFTTSFSSLNMDPNEGDASRPTLPGTSETMESIEHEIQALERRKRALMAPVSEKDIQLATNQVPHGSTSQASDTQQMQDIRRRLAAASVQSSVPASSYKHTGDISTRNSGVITDQQRRVTHGGARGATNTQDPSAPNGSGLPPSLAAVTSIFRRPISTIPPPVVSSRITRDTMTIEWRGREWQLSTMKLVDPLRFNRVMHKKAGDNDENEPFDHHIIDVVYTRVTVVDSPTASSTLTSLSEKGCELATRADRPMADSSTLASFTPKMGIINSYTQYRLAREATLAFQTDTEDAALMRAYQLMLLRTDPKLLLASSNLTSEVQFLAAYGDTPRVHWTSSWSAAECASYRSTYGSCEQIPHDADLKLRVITLDEYLFVTNSDEAYQQKYKANGKTLDRVISNEVFVPVFGHWLSDTATIPYILSFTTSAWHNGAVTLKTTVKDSRCKNGMYVEAHGLLEPCLYYIPGAVSRISLVVVDVAAECNLAWEQVLFGGFPLKHRWEGEQIAGFMHWQLGRYTPSNNPPWILTPTFTFEDAHRAVARIARNFHTQETALLTRSKAVSLFGSVSMGYGVSTRGPTEALLCTTPCAWNIDHTDARYKIGGTVELSDTGKTWGAVAKRLSTMHAWRTDAHCQLHRSMANSCKDNTGGIDTAVHYPSLGHFKYIESDRVLTTMSNRARIMSLCGLLQLGADVDTVVFSNALALYHYLAGQAALTAIATNWLLAESGTTITDLNGLTSYRDEGGNVKLVEVLNRITDCWTARRPASKSSYIAQDTFRQFVSITTMQVDDRDFFTRWYSGNVPLYMISAVIDKFDVAISYNSDPPDQSSPLDSDTATEEDGAWTRVGYFGGTHTGWYDTALGHATMAYEKAYTFTSTPLFRCVGPDRNGRSVSPFFLGWYPRAAINMYESVAIDHGEGNGVCSTGIIETLVTIVPSCRTLRFHNRDWWFVTSPKCHQRRDIPSSHIKVTSFTYPDPFWDWISGALKVALPSLLRGDIVGTAGAVGLYALDGALNWLASNFDQGHSQYSGD